MKQILLAHFSVNEYLKSDTYGIQKFPASPFLEEKHNVGAWVDAEEAAEYCMGGKWGKIDFEDLLWHVHQAAAEKWANGQEIWKGLHVNVLKDENERKETDIHGFGDYMVKVHCHGDGSLLSHASMATSIGGHEAMAQLLLGPGANPNDGYLVPGNSMQMRTE
ncbi:hypothetical protein AB5N19_14110 [Seiridium cardinale]